MGVACRKESLRRVILVFVTKINLLQIVRCRLDAESGIVEFERDKNFQSLFS